MIEFLSLGQEENSILIIFLSALIGGIIGASIKLVFEVILAERYNQRREAKAIINKYRNPIVSTADALRGRISNFLTQSDQDWFSQSEYYRLSTLYVFCAYFAWIEILFGNLTRIKYLTSKRNRRLNRILISIDKAFNYRDYFYETNRIQDSEKVNELPKFVCKALGELTIDHKANNEPSCLRFADFCTKYRMDPLYQGWVVNLEYFLSDIKNEYGNTKWDRMHIIQLSLIALTNFLDNHHELSRKYKSKTTKYLVTQIRYKKAREDFYADVVKYQLPIDVESKKKYFHRKFNYLRGKQPKLKDYPKPIKPRKQDLLYMYNASELDLTTKEKRRDFYLTIKVGAKKKTARLPYGTTLKLELLLKPEQINHDILKRIPGNIANITNKRILEEDVNIVFSSD